METKAIKLEVKELAETGEFSGYASVFGVVDHSNDVVVKGAFKKSLDKHKSKGTNVAMLWQHKRDSPIGVWQEVKEDDKGLFVKGKLVTGTTQGRETYELLKAGALSGLSIGYFVRDYEYIGGAKHLKEIELQEISPVTLPCNELARVEHVKSQKEIIAMETLEVKQLVEQSTKNLEEKTQKLEETFKKSLEQETKTLNSKLEKSEAENRQLKEEGQQLKKSVDELKDNFLELAQKQLNRLDLSDESTKSIGQQFIESEQFKCRPSSKESTISLEVKNVISTLSSSVGGLVKPHIESGFIALPRRELKIRDLLPIRKTSSDSIQYSVEKDFSNKASIVKQGELKPYSNFTIETKTAPVETIAHLFKVTEQALDDIPTLQGYINDRLVYGLDLFEEDQLLNGTGTNNQLTGLLKVASKFKDVTKFQTQDNLRTPLENLRLARAQVALSGFFADGIVVNPIDWENIMGLKDTTGRYLHGDPFKQREKTIWGIPVVTTEAIEQGKFLVGAFKMGAAIYDRWFTRVSLARTGDDFDRNLISLRGERRIALTVFRPSAFIHGAINEGVPEGIYTNVNIIEGSKIR
ncbi:phage major capsid protein [Bartonella sp. DGB1]|uniref:phage major capsid protein n=1 Tax=Bartonella sp. DGB1 TaxID=3239807 RepID=UPI003524C196